MRGIVKTLLLRLKPLCQLTKDLLTPKTSSARFLLGVFSMRLAPKFGKNLMLSGCEWT